MQYDPTYTEAYHSLATACSHLGEREKANEYRLKFAALKEQDLQKDRDNSRDYSDLPAQRRLVAAYHLAAGNVQQSFGDPQKAAAHWLRGGAIAPDQTACREALVSYYERQDQPAAALEPLAELLAVQPRNAGYWSRRGQLHTRLKHWEHAEADFRQAIALAPESAEGHAGLVELCLQSGRSLPDLVALAEASVRLSPSARAFTALGAVRDKSGDRPARSRPSGRRWSWSRAIRNSRRSMKDSTKAAETSGFPCARKQILFPSAWITATVLVATAWPSEPRSPCPIQIHEVTRETGIDFRHTDGSSARRYVIEPMSAGLATFDYDGDGLIDIYLVNGAPLPGMTVGVPPRNRLYRNRGGWQFTDVTDASGVGDIGYGLGIAAADYDNDGFQDLYLSNFGANVLYRNNGDGTFSDETARAGVASGGGIPAATKVGAGVCFFDIEGDGDLDLYCGNYMRFRFEDNVVPVVNGVPRTPARRTLTPRPICCSATRGMAPSLT